MNSERITQKLKYLIMMELGTTYELQDFYTEFEYDKQGNLEIYEIDLKFDYMGPIDASLEDFITDLRRALNPVTEALSKFPLTSKGELDLSFDNFFQDGPMIWDFNFAYDDKHLFHVSYRFTILQEK